MSEAAISAEGLGKMYRRGAQIETYKTARESLNRVAARAIGRAPVQQESRDFWALRDVNFELAPGGALGLVGRNGAGKTTLLKVLARITKPTAGLARVRGRVGTLLEVGTGFHPELTGRENIRLNGAILGMPRAEIARRFDEIVEFAEVESFIDTPVKRYSSGMCMRLAFSVAAHLEPDILIVDEVLAVGDAAFQRKCLGKLGSIGGEGRTVVFVSHNMSAVRQLCTDAILLEAGTVRSAGSVDEIVEEYLETVSASEADIAFEVDETRPATIARLSTRAADGTAKVRFGHDESIVLEAEWVANRTLVDDHVWLLVYRSDGVLLVKASDDDFGHRPPEARPPGVYVTRFRIPGSILNEDTYTFRIAVGKRRGVHHDDRTSAPFEIEDLTDYRDSDFGKRNGVLLVPLEITESRIDAS
jgi:lipopolysaccharide transport system ATP-binding protein